MTLSVTLTTRRHYFNCVYSSVTIVYCPFLVYVLVYVLFLISLVLKRGNIIDEARWKDVSKEPLHFCL